MILKFHEENHLYKSIVPDSTVWLGTTTIVHAFKEAFLPEIQAPKSSKNYKSKWYKVPVDEILQAWKDEGERAVKLGKWYHNKVEQQLYNATDVWGIKDFDTPDFQIAKLPVHKPIIVDGIKYSPNQILTDGIYPEHLVYLQSAGIVGQSDIVTVQNGKVDIDDHKTSKEIARESFKNWEGVHKKMLKPLHHLQDCHLNHYALQLSIYMYCILKWNPHLQVGKMRINHVKFVQAGVDKWGYPIVHLHDNEPIVESVEVIEVPYMKAEVQKLIEWMKIPANRQSITKH